MNNLAYNDNFDREELLNGRLVAMSPQPSINHSRISRNISRIFGNYLFGKTCESFDDGVKVHFSENDKVIPDAMIVCDPKIIEKDGIHGVPDLIVEILSPSTAANDKGYKKDLYERSGVKEYWIVDPRWKAIEVYLLDDGSFRLDTVYYCHTDDSVESMPEEERGTNIKEFKTSLFSDLVIPIEEVFHKTL